MSLSSRTDSNRATADAPIHRAVDGWHDVVRRHQPAAIDALLADDVVFHSPVVHSAQRGRALTRSYLAAAIEVLGNPSFRFVREVVGERDAVLEFEVDVDGVHLNGIDMIRSDDDGRIIDFKVMVRPLKAINLLHQRMGALLQASR
jgi:hypothetical protein